MARISDLITDSKLPASFLPDCSVETVHRFQESDPASRQRLVSRSEHWRRQRKIGGGGFGSVWLEECTQGGRLGAVSVRAVKQIDVDTRLGPIDYNRELEAIAKFSHPRYERCFVKSFGWYEAPGQLFIAMEYLELGDLFTYLYRQPPGPPLPETEAKEITYQILDAMNMMHDNGFAHRDLKPNNILIKSHPPNEWWIKLADFGISKRFEEGYKQSTAIQGTPRYFAPEIWGYVPRGSGYATDIWALGEIIFEMLTKKHTFTDPGLLSAYKTQRQFPVSRLTAAGISQPGVEFILSLMHPYPNDRETARSAISNMWLQSLVSPSSKSTTVINGKPQIPSSSVISNEGFASWNTNPSSKAPGAVAGRIDFNSSHFEEGKSAESEVLKSHSHKAESVALSSDDRTLASSSCEQTVRHWKPVIGSLHRVLKHSRSIFSVAFSPDGRLLACGCGDDTVRLWDPMTGALQKTLKHLTTVIMVDFSPNGQLLASSSEGGEVRLWDTATGALHRTINSGDSRYIPKSIHLAFLRDGRLLVSDRYKNKVRLLNPAKKVPFWDRRTSAQYRTIKHSGTLISTALSPDSRVLACVCDEKEDDTVQLWDTATYARHETLKSHAQVFSLLAFSPNSRILASGFPMLVSVSDATVLLWDTATGAIHHTLKGHWDSVRSVAFSPDGRVLASGSHDRTVRLWDTATGVLQQTLKGHSGSVLSVAFSPDGRVLVSGSHDRTVRLWDTATGVLQQTLEGHSNLIHSLVFSRDGRLLASVSSDNTVRIWEFPSS